MTYWSQITKSLNTPTRKPRSDLKAKREANACVRPGATTRSPAQACPTSRPARSHQRQSLVLIASTFVV